LEFNFSRPLMKNDFACSNDCESCIFNFFFA
jgi:hypothetical protein